MPLDATGKRMSALPGPIVRSVDAPVAITSGDRGGARLAEIFPADASEIAAGTDILKRGHCSPDVFILRRGWAFLYRILPDGRRQVLNFALPGEVLNRRGGIGRAATESVQALTDAAISAMPRDRLDAAAQRAPDIARQLAVLSETDRLLAYEHMTSIGRRSARGRIASLLLELFCRTHRRLPETPNETAPMPLTQNVIADALGLTSVHVNRTLRGLRDEGTVRLRHGSLTVHDPARFAALADLSRELFALITHADGHDCEAARVR